MKQTNFKKILLVRLSALGDVVHCLPALAALRRHFPEARLCWIVEEKAAGLLEGHPQLDRVIVMPRRRWTGALKNPLQWPWLAVDVIRFFIGLQSEGFDLSIDFQGNFRSGLVSLLSGAKQRLGRGRGHAKEKSHIFATHHHAPPPRVHRVERALALVECLGVTVDGAEAVMPIHPDAHSRMTEWMEQAGAEDADSIVVMHPGTSGFGALKQWDSGKFSAVAEGLAREDHALVILTWGSESEREECETVAKTAGEGVRVAPKMSLKDLAALLKSASVFIGCDTGPLHIAAALGTRVVGIYGPKDPVIYGPFGNGNIVVTSNEPCSPCTRRKCDHVTCMKNITAGNVLDAARKMLADVAH